MLVCSLLLVELILIFDLRFENLGITVISQVTFPYIVLNALNANINPAVVVSLVHNKGSIYLVLLYSSS